MKLLGDAPEGLKIRSVVGIAGHADKRNNTFGPLEFRGDGGAAFGWGNRKGDQGGRDIKVVEGARHAVLASDGGQSEGILNVIGPEKGAEGLAPAAGVVMELFKILLKGQPNVGKSSSRGYNSADRFSDGINGPMVRAPARNTGVKAPAHQGACIGFPFKQRDLARHGIRRGGLSGSTKGP